jgi:hypothetical protein
MEIKNDQSKYLLTNFVSLIQLSIYIYQYILEEIKVEKDFQGCSILPTLFKIFMHTALLN